MNRFEIKYDCELDLKTKNSLKLINDRIKNNSLILEFGPANGRFTRYLYEKRHCIVDIVEYNSISGKEAAKYARYALLGEVEGNIEKYIWLEKLASEKYDFIVFADVLEHLYDPIKALEMCKNLLKPSGAVLLSVPNVANNNIILNLLNDEFRYTSTGLLDDTHIRFFTYKSCNRIAETLGYSVSYIDYTLGLVGQTEIDVSAAMFAGYDMEVVDTHILGKIYQLVYELKLETDKFHVDNKENYIESLKDGLEIKYIPRGFYKKNGEYKDDTVINCETISVNKGKYRAIFNIKGLCTDGRFRFDPLENVFCEIEILVIDTDGSDCTVQNSNALKVQGCKYIFMTIDPIIEIIGDFSNATYIIIEYRINVLDEYTMFALLHEQMEELSVIKGNSIYKYFEKIQSWKRKFLEGNGEKFLNKF